LHQINERVGLKLFGREIIFEAFQPICTSTWSWHPQPHTVSFCPTFLVLP